MPDPNARPAGRPLDPATRRKMENAFGQDLSSVRVHEGALPTRLNAQAFTHGSDIFFKQGAYQPNTPSGKALLAHEIAHVLQQRGKPSSAPTPMSPADELKAKQLAEQALKNLP